MTKGTVKKQYSRKELLHRGINSIRAALELAQEYREKDEKELATEFYYIGINKAQFLFSLELLSCDETDLLKRIMDNIYHSS